MPMHNRVLDFWFTETTPAQWWKVDPDFDALIRSRFEALHRQAGACELYGWRSSAPGRLAEIIVLDQFSRNMHRGTPLALAQEAVAAGADQLLPPPQRAFLYLPYMHSESAAIHRVA